MVAGIWQTNGKNRFLKNNEKLRISRELFILWSNLSAERWGGGGKWVRGRGGGGTYQFFYKVR
jgi:hypothetical protein